MKSKVLFILLLIIVSKLSIAQSNSDTTSRKLSDKESQELLKSLNIKGEFKEKLLNDAASDACKCIDSINVYNKGQKQVATEINKCIDSKVLVYQTTMSIFENLKSTNGNQEIAISIDKDSKSYTEFYRRIEKRLMDSCKRLKSIVASENKESKYSTSQNPDALKQFHFGSELSEKQIYDQAIPYYIKAVELDPLFAFAWDNLGYCYRNTNKMNKAIEAYKKSLAINPYGEMPLQNIAVAYELNKEPDKAIEAYQKYLDNYPDGVEGYFGLGRQYMFYKKDYEKALENMCKAYNLYVKMKSPYRVDAEKMISTLYGVMKEKKFNDILKKFNITPKK